MTTATDGPSLAEALANLRATKGRSADLRARYADATCETHPDRPATFVVDGPEGTSAHCDGCHDRVADVAGLHVEVVR